MYVLIIGQSKAVFRDGRTYDEVKPTYLALSGLVPGGPITLEKGTTAVILRELEPTEIKNCAPQDKYFVIDMGSEDHRSRACICLDQVESLAKAVAIINSYQTGIQIINKMMEKDKNIEERIILAETLLKNTPNLWLQEELQEYITVLNNRTGKVPPHSALELQLEPLDKVISCIVNDGYPMENFCLCEIPIEGTYCFVSVDGQECFDIYAYEGNASPGYIHNSNETRSPDIMTAIRNYEKLEQD